MDVFGCDCSSFDIGVAILSGKIERNYIFSVLILKNNSQMGVWTQIAEYLYLKKKDPTRPRSRWIGYMHGINRISLFIFILCLIILAIKLLRK